MARQLRPGRPQPLDDLGRPQRRRPDAARRTHRSPKTTPSLNPSAAFTAAGSVPTARSVSRWSAPMASLASASSPASGLPNGAPVFDWSDVEIAADNRRLPDFRGGDGTKTPGVVQLLGSTTKDGDATPSSSPRRRPACGCPASTATAGGPAATGGRRSPPGTPTARSSGQSDAVLLPAPRRAKCTTP